MFKLARPNPSVSLYRRRSEWREINNHEEQGDIGHNDGEWLIYKGIYNAEHIAEWVRKNSYDPLVDLKGQIIDSFFVDGLKGFILLDFGQSSLLRVKIMLG